MMQNFRNRISVQKCAQNEYAQKISKYEGKDVNSFLYNYVGHMDYMYTTDDSGEV